MVLEFKFRLTGKTSLTKTCTRSKKAAFVSLSPLLRTGKGWRYATTEKTMKVSVYIATSLDGFTARKNGDIDWLMAADNSDNTEDYGYKEFSDSVDCMVMGRNSLEMVLSFPIGPMREREWLY